MLDESPGVLRMKLRYLLSAAISAASVSMYAAETSQDSRVTNAETAAVSNAALKAIGARLVVTNHLAELGWTKDQIAAFVDGIRRAFEHQPVPFDVSAQQASAIIGRQVQELVGRQSSSAPAALQAPDRFENALKATRKQLGLQMSGSGLAYRVETGRGGPRPMPADSVVFSCTATAIDGVTKLPQLSVEHATGKMADLFPGFIEGFQMMTVESRAVLLLPPKLSFGAEWPPDIERDLPIIFEVTLHKILPGGVEE